MMTIMNNNTPPHLGSVNTMSSGQKFSINNRLMNTSYIISSSHTPTSIQSSCLSQSSPNNNNNSNNANNYAAYSPVNASSNKLSTTQSSMLNVNQRCFLSYKHHSNVSSSTTTSNSSSAGGGIGGIGSGSDGINNYLYESEMINIETHQEQQQAQPTHQLQRPLSTLLLNKSTLNNNNNNIISMHSSFRLPNENKFTIKVAPVSGTL
jgi:hypothetical protein